MANFAFIDIQNAHRGTRSIGWEIDWARFRTYLKEKYEVDKAYAFIGYIPRNKHLYDILKEAGYELVFKPVIFDARGIPKGNCDADLILHAVVKLVQYDKAILVTSDGDFYSLVKYLYENGRLRMVLSSHTDNCSRLLKKEAKGLIDYMHNIRHKISKQDQAVDETNEKAPQEDETS